MNRLLGMLAAMTAVPFLGAAVLLLLTQETYLDLFGVGDIILKAGVVLLFLGLLVFTIMLDRDPPEMLEDIMAALIAVTALGGALLVSASFSPADAEPLSALSAVVICCLAGFVAPTLSGYGDGRVRDLLPVGTMLLGVLAGFWLLRYDQLAVGGAVTVAGYGLSFAIAHVMYRPGHISLYQSTNKLTG